MISNSILTTADLKTVAETHVIMERKILNICGKKLKSELMKENCEMLWTTSTQPEMWLVLTCKDDNIIAVRRINTHTEVE